MNVRFWPVVNIQSLCSQPSAARLVASDLDQKYKRMMIALPSLLGFGMSLNEICAYISQHAHFAMLGQHFDG